MEKEAVKGLAGDAMENHYFSLALKYGGYDKIPAKELKDIPDVITSVAVGCIILEAIESTMEKQPSGDKR